MSVHALLTHMGRGAPQRWAFDSDTAWQAACVREEEFLRRLEDEIEEQLGQRVPLVGTALDGSRPPRGELTDLHLAQEVGGTDGIAPIQHIAVAYLLHSTSPKLWRPTDPLAPSRLARDAATRESLSSIIHLVDHDPVTGFYLPVDFPSPIWLPGDLLGEGYDISIGSARRLVEEMQTCLQWLDRLLEVPEWLRYHANNLALVSKVAAQVGLALELA